MSLNGTLHAIPFNLIYNMTCYFQKKKCFDPLTPPSGLRMCVRAEYMLAWCSMLHTILFDLQRDYFSKNDFHPIIGVKWFCKDGICSCMVLCAKLPLI